MTTDLRDKTVEDWVDHLGHTHNAGCDGDHGTLSCCNQHNLIEVLERRLSEAEQKLAERDAMLAECSSALAYYANSRDIYQDERVAGYAAKILDSLPDSAKANAEILRAANKLVYRHFGYTSDFNELEEAVRAAKEIKDAGT